MSKTEFSKFTQRINIKSTAKNIYDAWTTPVGLESWFLFSAEFTDLNKEIRNKQTHIEEKDTYIWKWFGFPDYFEKGKVLWVNERDFVEFTFSGGCVVSVRIKRESGENICELTQMMPQENLEERQNYFIDCGKGWTFYLANLKSILEGGLDLRNRNNNLTNMINS